MTLNSIRVGQSVQIQRTFTQGDFDRFADLSGDDNPIHVDPDYAARTRFGRTVAHGMLLYSALEGVLGARLPGPGSLPLYQSLKFPTPTYAGEPMSIVASVTAVDGGQAELQTAVVHPGREAGLEGRARLQLAGAQRSGTPAPEEEAELPGDAALGRFQVGMHAELRRTFSAEYLAEYADLVGECNPLVTDSGYARRMGLQGQLVPGGLIGGLFSTLLGTRLPGAGTNYLKQSLHFIQPARPGLELVARVEIVRIRAAKQLINLRTTCTTSAGAEVCSGLALVLARGAQA